MDFKLQGRRRFLKHAAALAGFVAGAGHRVSAQETETGPEVHSKDEPAYGQPSSFETSARLASTPNVASGDFFTPLQDSVGIITPSGLHFFAAHAGIPDIDPKECWLSIYGMVDHPLKFTLDELKRMPSESRIYFLECQGNSSPGATTRLAKQREGATLRGISNATVQDTHGKTSCSEWTGVRLSVLFKETGLKKEARWVVPRGRDQWSYSLPLTKALDDVMVVYGQNGEAVRPEQGYPLRLFVPGWEGPHSVKWLTQMMVVDRPYMTWEETVLHSIPRGDLDGKARWYNFVMPPKSVIVRPSGGQLLPTPGFYQISGLAWSGHGAVSRAEVSVDGGRSWKNAKLQEPVLRMAHTRFSLDWIWDGGEAVLQSRCTDEMGNVQPSLQELNRDLGLSDKGGIRPTSHAYHFNAIQPWKVDKNGKVYDAMFA